jgi:hypothetical protein
MVACLCSSAYPASRRLTAYTSAAQVFGPQAAGPVRFLCRMAKKSSLGGFHRPPPPVEYVHDHQRIERLFFDGAPGPADGAMRPDPDRPVHGLTLRGVDTERYRRG